MTLFGWDASHYDAVPSGTRVVSEGITFATHKIGGDAPDAEAAAWWQAMLPVRGQVLLGGYWVLRRTDGAAAADAFLARLDVVCPGWRNGPFILQLDCESWNSGATPAPTKSQIAACVARLKAKAPKLQPIVYAPEWVYGESLKGLGAPLWASSYVDGAGFASTLYPGDSSSRWGSYSGQVPAILQFSSKATIAGQTTCDANAYRGSVVDLVKLLAPGWAPATPPKETDTVTAAADAVWNDDIITNPAFRTDSPLHTPPGDNEVTTAKYAMGDMWRRIGEQGATLDEVNTKLDQVLTALAGQGGDTPPASGGTGA